MPRGRNARTETPRFRPTVWPGLVIEVPPVAHAIDLNYGAGAIEYRPLPAEAVIRELPRLDVDDRSAVFEFVRVHGVIDPDREGLADFVKKGAPMSAYLRVAQVLVNHWLIYGQGGRVMEAWQRGGFARADVTTAVEEQTAWSWFTLLLNEGLSVFHTRVEAELIYPPLPGGDPIQLTTGAPRPDVFSGLCLQLWNLIVEDLPVRTCANEPCGRLFVRQQGRAEHGQYRTEGVTYCSRSCAKAQSERERRRRKRKETNP